MGRETKPGAGYWRRQGWALLPFGIWGAYIAFFALHIFVRSYADEFFPWRSPQAVDRSFTGTNPSLWLQSHLAGKSFALDRAATGAHLSWFAFPFLVALVITVCRRELLVKYFCWLTVAWFACDALFFLLPTRPPWMVDDSVQRLLLSRGWVDYAGVDTNPVAAFPSLHVCIPSVIGLFVWVNWRRGRWLAWTSWVYAGFIGFSVVYLGEHWVIDVVGGTAMAAIVAYALSHVRKVPAFAESRATDEPMHRPGSGGVLRKFDDGEAA
ncbi:MAG: phosphatase PAP2 family protein [Dehalococcoidia bacterium]